MHRATSQRVAGGCSAEPHAGRVDNEPRLQFSAGGDGRVPHRNAANFIALALDGVAALSPNGPGHAPSENQIVVRGVDDGVRVHFRQVALLDEDSVGEWFHIFFRAS